MKTASSSRSALAQIADAKAMHLLLMRHAVPKRRTVFVRAIAIVLAITGALAVSGIAAPAPAQAGRYRCDPTGGPYPGYAGPYAYAAYYYGYPPDCGGISFYFAPAYYGYRYSGPRYWYHGWHNGRK